jgi:hypothetical protein
MDLTSNFAKQLAVVATMLERDKWEGSLREMRHDIQSIADSVSGVIECDSVIRRIDEILEKRCPEPKTKTSST